jgi:hypothetical protein
LGQKFGSDLLHLSSPPILHPQGWYPRQGLDSQLQGSHGGLGQAWESELEVVFNPALSTFWQRDEEDGSMDIHTGVKYDLTSLSREERVIPEVVLCCA